MLVLPIELEFRRGDFGTYPVIGPIPAEDTTLRMDVRDNLTWKITWAMVIPKWFHNGTDK
jgi:hypothetical protein